MKDLVRMENISKTYRVAPVLKDVSIGFAAGEIHALMGANGAGKSTLMKILSGALSADNGSIFLNGKKIKCRSVRAAEKRGIVIIHQELNLIDELTAAQNIFLGREPRRGILLDDKKMERDSLLYLEKVGLDISPDERTGNLSVGKRQMLEIAKALAKNPKVLILDEPTAALSSAESERLIEIMKELKNSGICLIYISHRMSEIFRVADRISVLRDGNLIAVKPACELSENELVKLMVGKETSMAPQKRPTGKCEETVLEVKNLSAGRLVKDVSFSLGRGEVLGISGLVGAGRTETARAVMGIDKKTSGEIKVNGRLVDIKTPEQAKKLGMGYLSEDRKRDSLIFGKSVISNTVIASLEKYTRLGTINDSAAEKDAMEINSRVKTKYSDANQPIETLSGGNQQKALFARWIAADSDILIFDEPTRGIDVGAKEEIYKIIDTLAENGKSIIVISSESAELRRLCGRIIVMCEGRVTACLSPEESDDENLLRYATVKVG